ncbi:MAG: hypothetical protein HYT65_03820 [Candidatus Yanofskybacteria bacterium]|nr:hypothetical protein [Candidatus Yanofskybacteria bacterium]
MQRYKDELKTKKRKKLVFKLAIFLTAVIAVFAGFIYISFFAGIFYVRSISIDTPDDLREDLSGAVDDWLNTRFWGLTRRNNIFFISSAKLTSRLAEQFPKLESIKISADLPHSLLLSSVERKPAGIWCLPAQAGQTVKVRCFYFDKNGIAFSETQPSSGFLITNVTDKRTRDISLGSQVVADDWLRSIMSAKESLAKTDVSISEFVIPDDSFDEFDAKTAEGWKIMFSIQTDIEKQINALATFLKEKLKPGQRPGLQYVDLRIQDRIYYK